MWFISSVQHLLMERIFLCSLVLWAARAPQKLQRNSTSMQLTFWLNHLFNKSDIFRHVVTIRYTLTSNIVLISRFIFGSLLGCNKKMSDCFNVWKTYWFSHSLHCCSTTIHPLSECSVSLRPLKANFSLIGRLPQAWAVSPSTESFVTHVLQYEAFTNTFWHHSAFFWFSFLQQ